MAYRLVFERDGGCDMVWRRVLPIVIMGMMAACSAAPPRDRQLPGKWTIEAKYGMPRVNGRAFPEHRDKLPPNISKSFCGVPTALRDGAPDRLNAVFEQRNLDCDVQHWDVDADYVEGRGVCHSPEIEQPMHVDLRGSHSPTAFDLSIDLAVILRQPSGNSARMVSSGRIVARRLGDCD